MTTSRRPSLCLIRESLLVSLWGQSYVYFVSLGTQYNMGGAVSCPPTSRLTHSTGVRHLSRLHFPVSLTARCGLVANFWPLVTDNDAYNFQTTSLKGKAVHLPVPKTQTGWGWASRFLCTPGTVQQQGKRNLGLWVASRNRVAYPWPPPKAHFFWSLSWLMRTALSEREMLVSEQWMWIEISYVPDGEKVHSWAELRSSHITAAKREARTEERMVWSRLSVRGFL